MSMLPLPATEDSTGLSGRRVIPDESALFSQSVKKLTIDITPAAGEMSHSFQK